MKYKDLINVADGAFTLMGEHYNVLYNELKKKQPGIIQKCDEHFQPGDDWHTSMSDFLGIELDDDLYSQLAAVENIFHINTDDYFLELEVTSIDFNTAKVWVA